MRRLQEGLSVASSRRLRAEGRQNRHFNVHALLALRGNVPLRRHLESQVWKQNSVQIEKLARTVNQGVRNQ